MPGLMTWRAPVGSDTAQVPRTPLLIDGRRAFLEKELRAFTKRKLNLESLRI